MAHSDSRHDGEDEPKPEQDEEDEQEVILPPSSTRPEAGERVPYANEMLLLSFEGKHKKFEVDYESEGKAPSYRPSQSSIQPKKPGLIAKLKKLANKLFKPIP